MICKKKLLFLKKGIFYKKWNNPMKLKKVYLLAILFILNISYLFAQAPQHFISVFNTGFNGTVIIQLNTVTIDGVLLSQGDEIGAFTPAGLCVGAVVWQNNTNVGITVWGNNDQTPEIDGLQPGETIHYRLWKQSTNSEFSDINVTYYQGSGNYSVNCYFVVSSLYSGTAPDLVVPMLEYPLNESKNIQLQTLVGWYAVPGATHYKLQISESSDFATLFLEQNSITDTFFQVSNLNYITSYYWRVQAFNQTSNSFWCFPRKFTTMMEYLNVPLLLYPQPNAEDLEQDLTLKWAKVSNATQYVFQIASDTNFNSLRYSQIISDTTFNADNLTYNTTFYWRVRAKKGNSYSNWSEKRSFTIKEQEVPAPILIQPQNLSVNVALTPLFKWHKVGSATNYLFQLSLNADFSILIANELNLIDSTYTLSTSLEPNTQYYWRVATFRQSKLSDWSSVWRFTTQEETLNSPILNSPSNNAVGLPLTVNFVWNDVQNATSYHFQLSQNKEFSMLVKDEPEISQKNIIVKDLIYNTKYYWRVLAKNNTLVSNWSETWNFTSQKSQDTLQAPKILSPANNSNEVSLNPTFTWNKVEKAETYHIQISKLFDFSLLVYENENLTGTFAQSNGLELNTSYYWRVKCANEQVSSNWSEIWTFKTIKEIIIKPPDDWKFANNTGNSSTILLQKAFGESFIINGRNFLQGDAVGVFYSDNDKLVCAGYSICANETISVTVWGDNHDTDSKDGFYVDEIYTIKVWDSRAGLELNANVTYLSGPDNYQIDAVSIVGSLNTDIISKTIKIPLMKDWSLISSYINPNIKNLENIFMNYSSVGIVKNILNQRYIPNEQNEIGNWNNNEAYWVNTSSDDTLSITGTQIDPFTNPLYLLRGWTLLPYFLDFNQSCDVAFKSVKNDLLVAKDENGNLYLPYYNFNTIKTIYPGMGLKCFFAKNVTLTYNDTSKIIDIRKPPVFNENLIGKRTGNTAVIIATIIGYNGYNVAAYNELDQMVGIGTAMNNQAVFTVWGDDENTRSYDGAKEDELLSIKVFKDNDTVIYAFIPNNIRDVTQDEPYTELRYHQDAVFVITGTIVGVEENYSYDFDLNIRPNPASSYINIEYSLTNESNAMISLYSINGELIEVRNIPVAAYGINRQQFNISNLTSGIYFIKFQAGSKVIIKKFVVL